MKKPQYGDRVKLYECQRDKEGLIAIGKVIQVNEKPLDAEPFGFERPPSYYEKLDRVYSPPVATARVNGEQFWMAEVKMEEVFREDWAYDGSWSFGESDIIR